MSKQIEALKLALEALEGFEPKTFIGSDAELLCRAAITAIRDALADQPAQQWTDETAKVPDHVWDGMWKALEQKRKADSALDRMAENARELGLDYEPPCKTGSQCTSKCPQCEQPAQQQEPVAWITHNGKGWLRWHKPEDNNIDSVPLYTSPQSKPWVGLSTIELDEIDAPIRERGHATIAEIYRAIEAKLKERNT